MTSQAQVRRLLSLVPYLREHDGAKLTDVAEAFGITVKTLRDDLNVLWMCGMPGLTPGDLIDIDMDAVETEGKIHLSNADYLPRPLRLSTDEALALMLALRTLREIAGPGRRDAIERALAKLELAAGHQPTDRAEVDVAAGRADIRARVTDGLQRGKRLDLTYDVASRAETTRRQVDPLRLFVLEGAGYLDAWCYLAGDLRTFRLDRMAAVEVTETDVAPHPGVVLKDLSGGWFASLADAPLVTLDLAPWSSWVAEYYPTESVAPRPDGGLRVSLRVSDPAWLTGLVLRLGGGATVVTPRGAGDSARESAQEALDQYAALGLAD
ncbi:helix-turn-helix transcriptional regulator [Microlunatus ginsengisoli]|uniref:WYL domain-containing protein n=1 Tax=Microlunatus ginsengisoli TaxID=363863 RepID=A0ABP6ZCR0_9ACTN